MNGRLTGIAAAAWRGSWDTTGYTSEEVDAVEDLAVHAGVDMMEAKRLVAWARSAATPALDDVVLARCAGEDPRTIAGPVTEEMRAGWRMLGALRVQSDLS